MLASIYILKQQLEYLALLLSRKFAQSKAEMGNTPQRHLIFGATHPAGQPPTTSGINDSYASNNEQIQITQGVVNAAQRTRVRYQGETFRRRRETMMRNAFSL